MKNQTELTSKNFLYNSNIMRTKKLITSQKVSILLCALLAIICFSFNASAQCGFEWVETTTCTADFEVNTGTGYDCIIEMGDGTILNCSNGSVFSYQYSNPGSYTLVLTYYKNGVPACGATHNITIVDCSNSCDDCNITPPIIDVAKNGCTVILCTHGESNDCGPASYQWDMGDGSVYNNMIAVHDYAENGTYTACVTYNVTDSNGESCSEVVCENIEITDCDNSCCNFSIGNPMHNPFNPCMVYIPINNNDNSLCEYDVVYQSNGQVNNGFITFKGPGPHTVCITVTSNDCTLTECIVVETPECEGIKSPPYEIGNPRKTIVESAFNRKKINSIDLPQDSSLNIFPNPATSYFNIELDTKTSENLKVQLIDQSGRIVIENEKQLLKGYNQYTFNTTDLPRGVYVLKFASDHINQYQKLVLIK